MNLQDLMDVWRSQDASPLHGVNETLLRLALRQDEAKLRAQGRRDEWITYLTSAVLVASMAIVVVMMLGMLFYNDDGVNTVWHFVVPIAGAVPAVLMGVALHKSRRAQMLREQRFGESLRDQLGRQIAQLDYQATRAVWLRAADNPCGRIRRSPRRPGSAPSGETGRVAAQAPAGDVTEGV